MVQQQAWMAYSCLAHFSDQFSYIKHFIWIYRLKVIKKLVFQHLKYRKQLLLIGKGPGNKFRPGEGPRVILKKLQGGFVKTDSHWTAG
jgi:hypothetical protein